MQAGVEGFLEELIVRRELSDNFCHYGAGCISAPFSQRGLWLILGALAMDFLRQPVCDWLCMRLRVGTCAQMGCPTDSSSRADAVMVTWGSPTLPYPIRDGGMGRRAQLRQPDRLQRLGHRLAQCTPQRQARVYLHAVRGAPCAPIATRAMP